MFSWFQRIPTAIDNSCRKVIGQSNHISSKCSKTYQSWWLVWAGILCLAGSQVSIANDVENPTVDVNIVDTSLSDTDNQSDVAFIFSEAVFGFVESDLIVQGGVLSSFTFLDGESSGTSIFTATDDSMTTGSVTVKADSYEDATGNSGATGNDTVSVDTVNPNITISGVPAISNAAYTATFTFSEGVTGFNIGDIIANNATVSNFVASSDSEYTALITPTDDGSVTLDIAAGVAQDSAGNNNTVAEQASSVHAGYKLTIEKTTDAAEANNGVPTDAVFTITVVPQNATGDVITGDIIYSGSAINGTDYAMAPNSFSIADNESTATITLDVSEDSSVESSETIVATISNASSGAINIASATATLSDDDKHEQLLSFAFDTPTNKVFADDPFFVAASGGGSGNSVVISSQTTSVCTVSSGRVTIISAGSCTLAANQAGDDSYTEASEVTHNITIAKAEQVLSFGANTPVSKMLGEEDFMISISGGSSGEAVIVNSQTPDVCTINNDSVSMLAMGGCILAANQTGNNNYEAAQEKTKTIAIGMGTQTIIFESDTPSSKTFGDEVFNVVASGGRSGNAVEVSSLTTGVCIVDNGSITIVNAGSCVLVAKQDGNDNYAAASDIVHSIVIAKATQTINFADDTPANKTVDSEDFLITVTGGDSGESVVLTSQTTDVCTITNNTVTVLIAGTCTLAANQEGNDNYEVALEKTQNIAIGAGEQIVSFDRETPISKTFADGIFSVTATGGNSGNAVDISSQTPEVCSVDNGSVTIIGIGNCTLAANQAGNDNYTAANEVTHTISISTTAQVIAFNPPSVQEYSANETFSISAESDSGLVVSLVSDTTGVCSVSEESVTMLALGACTVSAFQGGDINYDAAETVSKTIYLVDASDALEDTDTDNNGIGEILEQSFGSEDIDGDGIPDALESLASGDIDATTDTDGDGTPDVIEILNGRDPDVDDSSRVSSPIITATTPKTLLAKGIISVFSHDELGVSAMDDNEAITPMAYYAQGACKLDVPYNYRSVCTPVALTGYSSGVHQIWWLFSDADSNWGRAQQTINILPQIGFSGDLTLAGEPDNGKVFSQLVLSGVAPNVQDFTIPFSVSGTGSNPEDHGLMSGEFTIPPGKTVSDPVEIILGSEPEDGRTLVITLDTSAAVFATIDESVIDATTQFVTAADTITQTVTISQGRSYPPRLSALKGIQGEEGTLVQGHIFDKTQGDIKLSFDLTDPDSGTYIYSWLNSDSELGSLSTEIDANPSVDISTLSTGQYYVEVQVSDSTAIESPAVVLGGILTILEDNALSAIKDTDGDGKPDAEEGLTDTDGDGRPDYLDAQNDLANLVPSDQSEQQNFLVKTKPGLKIIFGTTAAAGSTGGIKIQVEDLENHGDQGHSVSDADPENVTLSHVFDYEVENVEVPVDPLAAGNTIDVVLPLDEALTVDSAFLKYRANSGWGIFEEDNLNRIAWSHWSNDDIGSCPDAGDRVYVSDTIQKEGANCLQVSIEDGGMNDADGVVNGRIIDLLGVGYVAEETATDSVTEETATDSVTEETATDSVTEETATDSVTEETATDSVTEETVMDSVTEETVMDSVTEETVMDSVTEEATMDGVGSSPEIVNINTENGGGGSYQLLELLCGFTLLALLCSRRRLIRTHYTRGILT